jgi:hypothetical protein
MVFKMLVSFSVIILSARALAFADLIVAARKSSVISSLMEKRLAIRISKTILMPVIVIILQIYALKRISYYLIVVLKNFSVIYDS